jgi:flagellar biogenesis protein FliO
MTVNDWAALILAVISILGSFIIAIRWLVKHFLNELKPNGGSSMKDAVNRLERQVEEIYSILINNNKS